MKGAKAIAQSKFGHEVGHLAKETAKGVVDAGSTIGKGLEDAGVAIGKGVEKGADWVADETKKGYDDLAKTGIGRWVGHTATSM